MRKYILRYFVFWMPAVLTASFYNRPDTTSLVLQWFFAFFMLFGWSVNTGMCAYFYPRRTLSLIMLYQGGLLLLISGMYNSASGSAAHRALEFCGGILSFKPLEIIMKALLDFNIRHELTVTYILTAFCTLGYLAGIIYRHIRPNPYSPKIANRE